MMSQFFVLRQIHCVRPAHVVWRLRLCGTHLFRLVDQAFLAQCCGQRLELLMDQERADRAILDCAGPLAQLSALHVLNRVSLSRLVHRDNINLCTLGLKTARSRRDGQGGRAQTIKVFPTGVIAGGVRKQGGEGEEAPVCLRGRQRGGHV
jgi:hypothetical protein